MKQSRLLLPLLLLGMVLGFGPLSVLAQANLGQQDQQFVEKAAQGGMAEVELGQLAAEKAEADAVKQFGQRMVQDHSNANQKLMAIAQEKGINPPQALSEEQQNIKEMLSQMSGSQFDKAYMAAMVEDHQKTIDLFQKEAEQGQDPALKQFASETLPTLQEHLEMAQTTQQQLPQ